MHLYKNFFLRLKSNPLGVVIYFVIFVAMLIGLGTSRFSMPEADYEYQRTYSISYVDHDDSPLSRGLIDYLSVNNEMLDFSDRSESSILDMTFFSISEYHMDIEEGFASKAEAGEGAGITYTTNTDKSGATFSIDSLVNNYISAYCDYRSIGFTESEAVDKAKELLSNETKTMVLVAEDDHILDSNDDRVYTLNQFFGYLIIGFLSLGIGHIIIASNDKNIGDRIAAAPVDGKAIVFTNTLGLITSGVVIWAFFSAVIYILGHNTVVYQEYWWVYLLNTFTVMISACSLTALITSFKLAHNTLTMITNILSLAMSFICGVFVPQSVLSENLLKVSRFFPLHWMVRVNNMTIDVGHKIALSELWLCLGIQLLFAVAMAVLASVIKTVSLNRGVK